MKMIVDEHISSYLKLMNKLTNDISQLLTKLFFSGMYCFNHISNYHII